MLIVHHLEDSRSHRILWLLEELELDYEIRKYERDPRTRLSPTSLKKVHPLGKAPVIEHDGRAIAESGAIVEYIVDRFGAELRPEEGSPAFYEYRYWLHYAEGSAMTPFLLKLIFSELVKQGPTLAKPVTRAISKLMNREYIGPQIELHMNFWESHLAENDWFAGDSFTAADVQMSFPLEAAEASEELDGHLKISQFLERIHGRPAYEKAIERGGPYSL